MPRRLNPTQPTVESQERARAVIEMRTTGATFQEIADTLGYKTASGAYRAYSRALQRIPAPAIAQLRKQMETDLPRVQKALWPKVMAADVWAVQRLLDCWDRLARLRGMDAPARKQVEVISQSLVDAEIAKLEKELASHDRA